MLPAVGFTAPKRSEALLEASVQLEWFDIETQTEVYKNGIYTAPPVYDNETPEALCDAVERQLPLFCREEIPVVIGGNHTVSIGAMRSAAKQYNDLLFCN